MQLLDTLGQPCAPLRRMDSVQIVQTDLPILTAYVPIVYLAAAHVAAQLLLLVLLALRDSSLPLAALKVFASNVTIQPLQMATKACRIAAFA